jgi:DNA mismatch repair protein MutS
VVEAGAHALAAEAAHFEELTALAVRRRRGIAATADAIARIDVAASHARAPPRVAGACPPDRRSPAESSGGRAPGGRERASHDGERFVANDCRAGPSDRLWLITGPNMGGKSTFLARWRFAALLAQAGSYVPAARAKIGIVDRLFSRSAPSTTSPAAVDLHGRDGRDRRDPAQATPNSLVILDEIGRGTSTYDGLAIAWAVVEAMHDQVRAAPCSRPIITS